MRPTRRAILLFAATVPASLAIVLIDDALWPFGFALLAIAMFMTGIDAVRALPPGALEINARPPGLLYAGDSDTLHVSLSSQRHPLPTRIELLCEVSPTLERPPVQWTVLGPGESVRLLLPLVPIRRGSAHVERLWLRWRGPMGLMERQRIERLAAEIPIVPNVRAVRSAAIRFTARDAPIGVKPQNQQGQGSEFEALRDYVPGLDHRSIDWKHSARHRALVCKEFRAERNHQIIMAIDTGHLMAERLDGIPKLDHAINSALLLGYACLRHGDRVGLFGFDSQTRLYSEPVGGLHFFDYFLRMSAQLEYRPDETNFTLALAELTMRLKQRSLIILQTEFVDTTTAELMVENLGRLVARHVVLFVALRDSDLHRTIEARPRTLEDIARSVVAHDFARERQVVFERLRRLGVHCLEAPSDFIGTALVDRYLAIKSKELI